MKGLHGRRTQPRVAGETRLISTPACRIASTRHRGCPCEAPTAITLRSCKLADLPMSGAIRPRFTTPLKSSSFQFTPWVQHLYQTTLMVHNSTWLFFGYTRSESEIGCRGTAHQRYQIGSGARLCTAADFFQGSHSTLYCTAVQHSLPFAPNSRPRRIRRYSSQ